MPHTERGDMEEAAKRKRQSDPAAPGAAAPAAKRPAPAAPSPGDVRAAIAAVYAAYDALHRSSASPPSEEAAAHFAVLLDAARGHEAVQRLAARLLPKFAPRFPGQAAAAAAALQGLASLTLGDPAATQAVHADGVAGLRRVLLAAGPGGGDSAAEGALRFALERLAAPGGDGSAAEDALMGVARAAFVAAPRPALAATLALAGKAPAAAGGGGDAGLQAAATALLRDHLLAPVRAEDFGNDGAGETEAEAANGTESRSLLVRRLQDSADSAAAAWAAAAMQDLLRKGAKGLNAPARAAAEAAARELAPRQPTPPAPPPDRGARGKRAKRTPPAPAGPPPEPPKRARGLPPSSHHPAPPSPSPRLEEGELDDGELKPPLPAAAPPPPAGGAVLAGPCLYVAGLPRGLDHRALGAEADRHGGVTAVVMAGASGGAGGAGYVTFRSMRDAGAAYEALADQAPFRGAGGGGEPLRVRFCPGEPGAAGAPPPSHVWVPGVASAGEEAHLLRFLRAEAGAEPAGVTPLAGRLPGALLAFTSPAAAAAAEGALRRGWPPPRGGPGGRRRGPSPSPPAARPLPPPEYASESLWVGQVPLGRDSEAEMLAAFARFGPLAGHRILERTACAFVNFAELGAAVEARRALDGARVAGSCLVVEFKHEKEYWERVGRGGGGRGRGRERGRERERDWERGGRGSGREREWDHASPFAAAPPPPGSQGDSPARGRGGRRSRSRSRSRDRGGRGRGEPGVAAWPSANRLFSEFSEQLPPAPAAAAPAGLPPPARPAPRGGALWQGSLSKQRQPQAEVACLRGDPSAGAAGGWPAAEPAGWPAALEVQNRIPTEYVASTVLPAHPPGARAVLRLVPPPGRPGEAPRLAAFASYLRGKQRTGVVDLGPGPQPGAPRGRILYLIPPDEGACRAVGLRWSPADGEAMLAVVVPKTEGL